MVAIKTQGIISGKRKGNQHPPRGAKWMVRGATKRPLRVQTPPLGWCRKEHDLFQFVFQCFTLILVVG